jgi:membrane-associated phospholipid phosphatase
MIAWPIFGIPIALGAMRQYRRLQLFTLATALSLLVTIVISVFVPAFGVYNGLSIKIDPAVFASGAYLSSLHDMPLIRDGTLRQLDISNLAGIVTFPSFHACAAVLFLWALWGVWWMRPLALIANVGMLLATPMAGGHYFVDVFAGIAVAVLAIAAANRLSAWLTQGVRAPVAAMNMPEAAVPAE